MQGSASDLHTRLAQWGVSLPADRVDLMKRHIEGVLRVNAELNLTRITDASEVARLHILDSLLVLPELLAAPSGLALDLGSGAGFPGIPLSLATGREFMLVESIRKKAAFLDSVVGELGLVDQISVYPGRSEELAAERPGSASVVLARAVAPLAALVELATPLLRPGGQLLAMKARITDEEVESGQRVSEICGFTHLATREYRVVDGGEERTVLLFEKTGESQIQLPRRPGMARKRPLA